MTLQLPTFYAHPGHLGGGAGEGEEKPRHFSVERVAQRDVLIVQCDGGPRVEIPMRLLAQGKTIAQAYEEVCDA